MTHQSHYFGDFASKILHRSVRKPALLSTRMLSLPAQEHKQESCDKADSLLKPIRRQTARPLSVSERDPEQADNDEDSDADDLQLKHQQAEFYDSEADDKDQAWMHKQRQGRHSDAILSCPGCLTTVCIDCQRHEYYTTQYRAMFVRNCRSVSGVHHSDNKLVSAEKDAALARISTIPKDAALARISTIPKDAPVHSSGKLTGKRQRQASQGQQQPSAQASAEAVYPVFCAVCDAELGIQDSDQVVHFFNTFPSTA